MAKIIDTSAAPTKKARQARFELCRNARGAARWWWVLISPSGKTICTSEKFLTKTQALRAANQAIALLSAPALISDEIWGSA